MRANEDESGQASVELVAVLPLIAGLLAVVLQAVLAGEAIWSAQSAARAGARAHAVRGDVERAARGALAERLEHEMSLRVLPDGGVRVSVPIPALIGGDLGRVSGSARMEPQR